MTDELHLNSYDNTPVFTIKTVVQETGIPPATLRAWERRYGVLSPGRSEGGYRLYSERDIAILRWLKRQVDAGVCDQPGGGAAGNPSPGRRTWRSAGVTLGRTACRRAQPGGDRDDLLNALDGLR